MPDGSVRLPPDSTGTTLRTVTNAAVAAGAHQEVVTLALADGSYDVSLAALRDALRGAPAGTLDAIRALLAATLSIAGTVAVSNPTANPETGLAKDVTLLPVRNRFNVVTTAKATYTTGGDHTLVTPPAGQSLRVTWIWAQAKAALDTGTVTVTVTLGASSYAFELTGSQPFSHGAVWEGTADQPLVVNTSSTAAVMVNVDYRSFT